jgi:hypothetical protein
MAVRMVELRAWRGRRPRQAAGGALALLLLLLLALLLLYRAASLSTEPDRSIPPPQATAVAVQAAAALGQAEIAGTPAPVVAAGGALVAPAAAAEATAQVQLANGSVVAGRVQSDRLRGIAVVDADGDVALGGLEIGDSRRLVAGTQLVLAPGGGAAPLRVTYLRRATIQIEGAGLLQYVLDLELPPGSAPRHGPVLDASGRLVGLVVPDRQQGAPAGHVFAVPAEQARPLLERFRPAASAP